ncbi:MAG: HAD family phosphatase [Vicinamibacterales bacterium]
MSSIQAVVFDFDGVLADTEQLHLAAYQEVFSARGVTLTRDEYYATLLGYNDEVVFRRISASHCLNLDPDDVATLIAEKTETFDSVVEKTDVLYPAAASCIERLAHHYPLGIASGAMRHEIEMILRRARLAQYIRFIVASGDTIESKPAPDPYVRAAQLHAFRPSECVAIEDSRWGIASAKAAGMKCVGITNTYPASELTEADFIISTLDEFTSDLIHHL